MKIYEIANAEEQLSLLRIIIDKTWSAIAQQALLQKRARALSQTRTSAPQQQSGQVAGTARPAKATKKPSLSVSGGTRREPNSFVGIRKLK